MNYNENHLSEIVPLRRIVLTYLAKHHSMLYDLIFK
jgi:hypothetical protein